MLDELITRRQDELRGRPLNWRDHLSDRVRRVDWSDVAFTICVAVWAICEVVVTIAKQN
jgi:hypothetical protein